MLKSKNTNCFSSLQIPLSFHGVGLFLRLPFTFEFEQKKHLQVGHVAVCNVIFITASSSHDCVLFKFELACQHTNLIDFNSTNYNLLIFEQFSRSPAGGSQGYAQPCSP